MTSNKCPHCNGEGQIKLFNSVDDCTKCHGTGVEGYKLSKTQVVDFKKLERKGDRFWFNCRWMTPDQILRYRKRKQITSARYHNKNKPVIRDRKLKHYEEHKTELNKRTVEMRKTGKWKKKQYSKEYHNECSKAYYRRNREEVCRKLREKRALLRKTGVKDEQ